MKTIVTALLIAATTGTCLFAASGVEPFDIDGCWYGGAMQSYTEKYYTNTPSALNGGVFSSDSAARETNVVSSSPFAWRVAKGTHWFRFETRETVTNFSVWLKRVVSTDPPDVQVRYSDNSGATYQNLYNGTLLLASTPVYTQYVSPTIMVRPRTGQKVYIEVNKSLGDAFLADDFALNMGPVETNIAWLVLPAPCVTSQVGGLAPFLTTSTGAGAAQIGYGRGTTGAGWTWLATGATNAGGIYGATNAFWLASGEWWYAARWLYHYGAVTNYTWNNHGQINQTTLRAVEYRRVVTNAARSVVWRFDVPGSLAPIQGPPDSTLVPCGVATSWPVGGGLGLVGFPTANMPNTNASVEVRISPERQLEGIYLAARRDATGPHRMDIQCRTADNVWHALVSGAALDEADAWYMIGGPHGLPMPAQVTAFRIMPYSTDVSGGMLYLDEIAVTRGADGSGMPLVAITSSPATVDYLVTTADVAGTNNANVFGSVLWTNLLNGTYGSAPVSSFQFQVSTIPLAVGSNAVVVSGTNSIGVRGMDTAVVVRAQAMPGEMPPYVAITNPPRVVTLMVTSCTVAGTNNTHVIGGMRWRNVFTGGSGGFPAATAWTVADIALLVGTNMIVLSGTNLLGVSCASTTTVERLSTEPPRPSDVDAFQISRDPATPGAMRLSWSNNAVAVLVCTNRHYVGNGMYWSVVTNNVFPPWIHTAASNYASVYYRIASGTYTSRYDLAKYDVVIASGSIAWISFPFSVQHGCDVLGEWFDQQVEAQPYSSFTFPVVQWQDAPGGTILSSDYYINDFGGGTTNWVPNSPVLAAAGYVLFLPAHHHAFTLTSLGMVATNDASWAMPYGTIPWIALPFATVVPMGDSGVTNLFFPPMPYSSFNYDFIDSQVDLGGADRSAEFYMDDWGGGTTNFFPTVPGADMFEPAKGYLMFFSSSRSTTQSWRCARPY